MAKVEVLRLYGTGYIECHFSWSKELVVGFDAMYKTHIKSMPFIFIR